MQGHDTLHCLMIVLCIVSCIKLNVIEVECVLRKTGLLWLEEKHCRVAVDQLYRRMNCGRVGE